MGHDSVALLILHPHHLPNVAVNNTVRVSRLDHRRKTTRTTTTQEEVELLTTKNKKKYSRFGHQHEHQHLLQVVQPAEYQRILDHHHANI